jgi:hypothetical protein
MSVARILKYTVPVDAVGEIVSLRGAVLYVDSQESGQVQFWAYDDPDAEPVDYYFRVFGTGHPFPLGMTYVGTAIDGPYVRHLLKKEASPW